MSLGGRLREQVIIYNRTDGAADVFGEAVDTFDEGTTSAAWVQVQSSREDIISNRDTRITGYIIVLPADASVFADSEIEWNDRRMRIQGRPQEGHNHHGLHHVEVSAEYLEG